MIVLRDKQFGWRDKLADYFDKKANKHQESANKEGEKLVKSIRGVQNPLLREKLKKVAEKEGAGVSEYELKDRSPRIQSQAILSKDDIRKFKNVDYDSKEEKDEMMNAVNKSKHGLIISPKGSGEETLSHEIGHVKNKTSKNPVTKAISNLSNRETFKEDSSNKPNVKTVTGWKRFIKGKEEKNATNKGYEILKKEGATKYELNKAKESMDTALKNYEHKGKAEQHRAIATAIRPKQKNSKGSSSES